MTTTINYDEFMKNASMVHSDLAMNYHDAIKIVILQRETHKEQIDMVTYNYKEKFLLFSSGFLQADENDNYFFEYTPKRDCDIIDNIEVRPINKNIKITYYIGGQQYDPQVVKEFIFVAAMYHEFKIRITFLEKPTENFEFVVHSRNYIMETELRKKLMVSRLTTNSNIYNQGMCTKI
jgi:hypothetical protein